MIASRTALLAAVIAVGLALSSCGGDDTTTVTETVASGGDSLPVAVAASADRNCRQMLREVRRVGRRASEGDYRTALELTIEGYTAPGLRLIKRLARRQEALQPAAADPRFDLYVDAFDPIITLGEQGLRAGRAEDVARVVQLRDLLTGLGADQRQLARRAGLQGCDVDFLNALVSGASG